MQARDDDAVTQAERRAARRGTLNDEQDSGEDPSDPEMEIEDAAPEEVGYGYGV